MTKSFEIPVPVFAKSPDDLYSQVMKKVQSGYDFHSSTAVLLGKLMTWMVYQESIHTYVLVYREDLDQFAENIQSLSARGYDQVFPAFEFGGYACQWMAKEQASGYADVFRMPMIETNTPTPVAGFNLVEGVHVLGRLSSMKFLPGEA